MVLLKIGFSYAEILSLPSHEAWQYVSDYGAGSGQTGGDSETVEWTEHRIKRR